MSKEKGKTQNKKRKLTRQEKKQIDALIRQSKGDGKPHTAQDSIPFERMYKDGICRLANGRYSKCIEFEDINYLPQLIPSSYWTSVCICSPFSA